MKKVFKKIVEVFLIAIITSVAIAAAANYRSLSDVNLVLQYTNGVITDLVDGRGNLVGLVTSTNNQSLNTIGLTGNAMLCNSTPPTIASGFGASAVVAASNGSCTFQVNVGATSVTSTGVLTMPSAKTGWNCFPLPVSSALPQTSATMVTISTSVSSVTVSNFTDDTGAALNWGNNEVIAFTCSGY